MLVENKILKRIKELGLNSYEAKIWTALLSRGVSTAGEISDIANVPRSRSYDVLESLEKKGFIIMKIGKPIQYIAVPPEDVLDRVKKDVQKEADEKVGFLEEFQNSDLLEELNHLHTDGIESVDPTEITGFVKGRENIYHQMSMMIKNAENNVKISTTKAQIERMDENLTRAFNKSSKENVDVMIACNSTTEEMMKRDNVDVKNTGLNGRFLVVDSRNILLYITPEDTHPTYETAIWVESAELASVIEQTFDNSWNPQAKVETRFKAEVTKKV